MIGQGLGKTRPVNRTFIPTIRHRLGSSSLSHKHEHMNGEDRKLLTKYRLAYGLSQLNSNPAALVV